MRRILVKQPVSVSKAVIIADLSDIKYCPHRGKLLPTRALTCPNCGFKFYSNLEEKIRELLRG